MSRMEIDLQVHWRDCDAAGVIFYSRLFEMAHDAYEELLERVGCSVATVLATEDLGLPIVHATADFKLPMRVGERLRIALTLLKLGSSSFTLGYRFLDEERHERARAETVHVAIEPAAGTVRPLPDELRRALEAMLGVSDDPEI